MVSCLRPPLTLVGMDVTQGLKRVVGAFGTARFEEAAAWAWRTAVDTGTPGYAAWPDDAAEVPHQITGRVGDAVAAARADANDDIDENEARRWGF